MIDCQKAFLDIRRSLIVWRKRVLFKETFHKKVLQEKKHWWGWNIVFLFSEREKIAYSKHAVHFLDQFSTLVADFEFVSSLLICLFQMFVKILTNFLSHEVENLSTFCGLLIYSKSGYSSMLHRGLDEKMASYEVHKVCVSIDPQKKGEFRRVRMKFRTVNNFLW